MAARIKPLWFATYIDGDETTTEAQLLLHHSISCSQQIAAEHVEEFLRHFDQVFADPELGTPSKMPFGAFHRDSFSDWLSDTAEEPWMSPYAAEFKYMVDEDESAMDYVYMHRRRP